MNTIKSYRDLIVWQKAMRLVNKVYLISKKYPTDELYGLCNQTRRSAVSIPSNIAEGYGRNSTNDYKRFLQMSLGSLYELETQIEIAYNLQYIDLDVFNETLNLCTEIDKMLYSLIKKIN